jgi:peptidyl-prolyl cis-trans isomerase B (cyclophilin B)
MATTKRERQRTNRQARLEAAVSAQRKAQTRRRALRIGALVAGGLLVALLISIFAGGGDDDPGTAAATTVEGATTTAGDATATTAQEAFTYGSTPCPAEGGPPTTSFTDAFQQCIDPAANYTATFETSAGRITAELDTGRTPGTVNNFVALARSGYYADTKLFRTDPSIGIIQGGGQTNSDNPGYTIPDEGGTFTYTPGDLVMARTMDPNSAGGQFFFAVDENTAKLDSQGTYVTFGQVTEGLDVLQAILASHQEIPGSGLGGAPDPPGTFESVSISES